MLLRPSDDAVIFSKQRLIHNRVLDAEQVVRIILERPGCENRWRTIREALLTLGEVPRDLKDKLSTTRWISNGVEAVAPEEIIRIVQPLDQRIHDVLAEARPGLEAPRGNWPLLSLPQPFPRSQSSRQDLPRPRRRSQSRARPTRTPILATDVRFLIRTVRSELLRRRRLSSRSSGSAPSEVMPCHSLIADICGKSSAAELRIAPAAKI